MLQAAGHRCVACTAAGWITLPTFTSHGAHVNVFSARATTSLCERDLLVAQVALTSGAEARAAPLHERAGSVDGASAGSGDGASGLSSDTVHMSPSALARQRAQAQELQLRMWQCERSLTELELLARRSAACSDGTAPAGGVPMRVRLTPRLSCVRVMLPPCVAWCVVQQRCR